MEKSLNFEGLETGEKKPFEEMPKEIKYHPNLLKALRFQSLTYVTNLKAMTTADAKAFSKMSSNKS